MTQVVLFGTGAMARVVHHYLTHESPHEVVAFAVDRSHWNGGSFQGLPIVSFEDVATAYPPQEFAMFIAVGYRRVNRFRAERYQQAKAMGYQLITHISPRASTWPGLQIGDNCFVMDEVIIHPFAQVGNDVILWSGSHIGHDSVVGDHNFVSSRAVVSGYVTVGDNCFIGSNATLRDGITIARESVVGAGVVINRDTKEGGVYAAPQPVQLPLTSDRLPNL
jgi:sugar O-acyltransferase (sialic acid O-acetyltransferase NeuD family)